MFFVGVDGVSISSGVESRCWGGVVRRGGSGCRSYVADITEVKAMHELNKGCKISG